MISILRLIGVVNAAVWLGAAIFFTLVAAPAIFSGDMRALLGSQNYPYFSGAIAQIIIARYFVLQHWCGAIALAHLLVEWLYLGKPLEKITLGVLVGIFSLGLVGGFWLQPKLKELHRTKYGVSSTAAEREKAARSFAAWHGASQVMNLGVLLGLVFYTWRATNPSDAPRFFSTTKFQ